jgi:hypothetical protein
MLIRALAEAVSSEPSSDSNDATMIQYYVTLIFEKLDNDVEVPEGEIARLEWAYLRVLEFSNREPKALPKYLATSPKFFVELLSTVYRGENEDGLDEMTCR